MKRTILLLAACAVALLATGCATQAEQQDKYTHKAAMLDKRIAAIERANAAPSTPACQLVGNDTGTITMSGVKSFTCYGAQPERQAVPQEAADEKSGWAVAGDFVLETVKVLANPVATVLMNSQNQATSRHLSDNGVKTQAINMGTLGDVATKAIQEPPVIVGPTGVLYPYPPK